ncbi:MAG: cytochrome c [Planctomycetota bacterium]|nr:cytochrome c [Planctomycetota bacterium]MDA1114390.1 cytochrome c [Planctomycetota bacterium]
MASPSSKSLLGLCLLGTGFLFSCGDQEPTPVVEEVATSSPAEAVTFATDSGKEVYTTHCAVCHGEKGDGIGLVTLDRPARSFLQGGFSFGNTPEAIYRTISNGIGGTPMPGFSAALSEKERRAVTEYVIAFGPEQIVVKEGETVLAVQDRPQVIRGSFPPVADGVSMTPRGLMVGGLDGLSFQYDASDLRLLAVRQGAFVDRADWGDRGGAALKPLGQTIFLYANGAPNASWWSEDEQGQPVPFFAQLLATEVEGDVVWVEYKLMLNGVHQATVRESGKAVSYGAWSGFRRSFEVSAVGDDLPYIVLAQPSLAASHAIFEGAVGDTTVFERPEKGALIVHRERWTSVHAQNSFNLTEDLVFGLEVTEENLATLLEELF